MEHPIPANQLKWLYGFIAAAVVVNFSGLFVTLIAPDATLYATIAKNMVQHHDYINLYANGQDWLDKPHFPFWITALSFNIFGITTWAYKLPGILFLMMGAWYAYKLAKSLYNEQIALWAVLILLTAQHIVISDNDVRAEPYLTGLIIASVYHFYKGNIKNSYWQLLAGCVFTACAIMTKGMFAVIPIGGAIIGHFIVTKQWKQLFNLRWLIAIVITLILILPELYCLYQQFDLHPEKVVFGQRGVSGIKFFFWDSQFGRFFNTGPIKGGGDPTFFIHTTLWAFLPWSLLLFVGIFQFIKKGVKNVAAHEWYCISGGLLTFLLFSASKFQLPYYLNIVYPFFAIITAQYLYSIQNAKSIIGIRITQITVIVLILTTIGLLEYFFLPLEFKWPAIILLVVIYILLVFLPDMAGDTPIKKIVIGTVIATFIVNLYLNVVFYPSLLQYQSGSSIAQWINKTNPKNYPVMQSGEDYLWPMQFYLNQPVSTLDTTHGNRPANTFLLYASADFVNTLTAKGWHLQETYETQSYNISRLKPVFLNSRTRKTAITMMQLVLVNPPYTPPVILLNNIGPVKPSGK